MILIADLLQVPKAVGYKISEVTVSEAAMNTKSKNKYFGLKQKGALQKQRDHRQRPKMNPRLNLKNAITKILSVNKIQRYCQLISKKAKYFFVRKLWKHRSSQ